jgi:hypothetical protein
LRDLAHNEDVDEMATGLFFEDLRVGQAFRSPELRITPEMWSLFLDTMDLNEDPPAQADERGWIDQCFSYAVTMRLIVSSDFKPSGGILGLHIKNLAWRRPLRIGDVLRSESTISDLRKRPDRRTHGLALLDIKTRTTAGDVVQEMTPSILVPYRDPG